MTTREPTQRDRVTIVAVANEVVDAQSILEAAAGRDAAVFVVAPALNTPVRHWCSDDRRARAEASRRLERTLAQLRAAGVDADGWVGDSHPLTALADALAVHRADHIVVATAPEDRANWLARGLAERVRRRFGLPLAEVIVDVPAPARISPVLSRRPAGYAARVPHERRSRLRLA